MKAIKTDEIRSRFNWTANKTDNNSYPSYFNFILLSVAFELAFEFRFGS